MLPKKKKLEKWPFLDQNDGLTPMYGKNVNFSTFWTSCFYSLKDIFLAYIALKKKSLKNSYF